jgi:hypothetical protein
MKTVISKNKRFKKFVEMVTVCLEVCILVFEVNEDALSRDTGIYDNLFSLNTPGNAAHTIYIWECCSYHIYIWYEQHSQECSEKKDYHKYLEVVVLCRYHSSNCHCKIYEISVNIFFANLFEYLAV